MEEFKFIQRVNFSETQILVLRDKEGNVTNVLD
jgi:hypothetical protein